MFFIMCLNYCNLRKILCSLLLLPAGTFATKKVEAPQLNACKLWDLLNQPSLESHIESHHHLLSCSKELNQWAVNYSKSTNQLAPEVFDNKVKVLHEFYKNGLSTI